MKGIVFDIQRFSVHDGPGIRTTVFMKGCPLRCRWCHNPEGLSNRIQLQFFEDKCVRCGACGDRRHEKDASRCQYGALLACGKELEEDDLVYEVMKDSIFYDKDGGITFSGGECMQQADFVAAVLKKIKIRGLTTAIDTSGYVSWTSFEKTNEYCDLYLYDIKNANSSIHKKYTGVGNELILKNLRKLSDLKKRLWIRVPVIPGFNDDIKDMTMIAEIVSSLSSVEQVTLMPYHSLGSDRYKTLGLDYMFDRSLTVSENRIKGLKEVFLKRKILLV